MAVRLLQKNGSDNITASDDARVNFALFGTCRFSGIGEGMEVSVFPPNGGKRQILLSPGRCCFGGYIVTLDSEESFVVPNNLLPKGPYLVLDLRILSGNNAYLTTDLTIKNTGSITTTKIPEIGLDEFPEKGGIYAIQVSSMPKRNPGESLSCRKLTKKGKLGNTLLTDLFEFDGDDNITDFKSIEHCTTSDYAGGFIGSDGKKYPVGDGLNVNGWYFLLSKKVATSFSIPKGNVSLNSSQSIFSDTATHKVKMNGDAVTKDSILPLFISTSGNETYTSHMADAQSVFTDGCLITDDLQMAIGTEDGTGYLYWRWISNPAEGNWTDVTVTLTGTMR